MDIRIHPLVVIELVLSDGRLAEQTGQQGHEGDADQSDTATGHQLLHALGLRTGVVVAVTFQQVDDTPNAQTGTQRNNESLQDTNSRVKKFHRLNIAERKECKAQTTVLSFDTPFKNFSFIDF